MNDRLQHPLAQRALAGLRQLPDIDLLAAADDEGWLPDHLLDLAEKVYSQASDAPLDLQPSDRQFLEDQLVQAASEGIVASSSDEWERWLTECDLRDWWETPGQPTCRALTA